MEQPAVAEVVPVEPKAIVSWTIATRALGVTTTKLRAIVNEKKLTVHKNPANNRVFFYLDDLEEYQRKKTEDYGKKQVGKYRYNAKCKVTGCDERPHARFFCLTHYGEYQRGKLLESGENNAGYIARRNYGRDFRCFNPQCRVQGSWRYRLGFCDPCYQKYQSGFLDFDANETSKERQTYKYGPKSKCLVYECDAKPSHKEFCQKHYSQFMRGFRDERGRLVKDPGRRAAKECSKICKLCGAKAVAKDLCSRHYRAYNDYGDPNETGYKNKGRACSIEGCDKQAATLTMCHKHYYRHKNGIPMDAVLRYEGATCGHSGCEKSRFAHGYCKTHYVRWKNGRPMEGTLVTNKGKTCCLDGCEKPAKSKGLCNNHYTAMIKRRQREQDLEVAS